MTPANQHQSMTYHPLPAAATAAFCDCVPKKTRWALTLNAARSVTIKFGFNHMKNWGILEKQSKHFMSSKTHWRVCHIKETKYQKSKILREPLKLWSVSNAWLFSFISYKKNRENFSGTMLRFCGGNVTMPNFINLYWYKNLKKKFKNIKRCSEIFHNPAKYSSFSIFELLRFWTVSDFSTVVSHFPQSSMCIVIFVAFEAEYHGQFSILI